MGLTELDGMSEDEHKALVLLSNACEMAAYAQVSANTIASCATWIAISIVRNREQLTNITKQQFIDTITKQWDSMTLALEQGAPNASNLRWS